MFARRLLSSGCRVRQITPAISRFDHTLSPSSRPTNFPQWRKEFFSSKINHQHAKPETPPDAEAASVTQKQKRKLSKSPAAKISLRRVAVEAQRSKDGMRQKAQAADEDLARSKVFTSTSCDFLFLFCEY